MNFHSCTTCITYNNREIFVESRRNPEQEAKKYLRVLEQTTNILILFGLTTKSFFKALLSHIKNKKLFVIAIDWDKQLINILKSELPEIFEKDNVFFFQKENIDQVPALIESLFYLKNQKNIKYQIIKNINLYKIFKEFFDKTENQIASVFKNIYQNILIVDKFKTIWLQNIKKNINQIGAKKNIFSLTSFKSKFKGKPVLIVNAGPSLDKHLDKLKQWQKKFYIIAVDTALRTLMSHNIKPDFVISLDSQLDNFLDFTGVETEDLNLIAEITSNHKIIEKFQGKMFLFYTAKMLWDFFQKKSIEFIEPHYKLFSEQFKPVDSLQTGGSVSTTALDFALYAGFDPIIFVAQDLSFLNYKIYCKGTYVDIRKQQMTSKFYNYETIISDYIFSQILKEKQKDNENIIVSSFVLQQYRLWLEQALSLIKEKIYFFDSVFFKKWNINEIKIEKFPNLEKKIHTFDSFNREKSISQDLEAEIKNYLQYTKNI